MKSVLFIKAVFFFIIFSSLQVDAQVPVISGGSGAPAGTGENGANNAGGNATGLGCGGGGGSWWGGSGGAGRLGGGGGGAGGYFSLGAINWAGGEGGQGVVVIAYYNGVSLNSTSVLTTGTSVTVPGGITSVKVWAIGAGGGGGGATESDGSSGGSGGAGGVAYVTKAVSTGNLISYSIGASGKAGHGINAGTAGGTTSATVAGTTIYGYGGAAGLYNSATTAAGGSYTGGDGGATGGSGVARSGDQGGGGGGAIGGVAGTQAGNSGGTGSNAADVSGLFAACAIGLQPVLPTITSFTPTSGLAGTILSITGTGFTNVTAVRIGGVNASSYSVNSATSITATISGSTVSGSVSVTADYTTVSKAIYLYLMPVSPSISSFSPTSAQRGVEVTINGSGFLGASAVSFGGTPALSFTTVSDYIVKAIPGNSGSGSVSVTTSGGTGTLAGFTWLATTAASSVSFSSIHANDMVVSWTNGNAQKRAVFIKQGAGSITDPSDNTTYTASSCWSTKGTQLGSSGYYCVYNGTGTSLTLTGLVSATSYNVRVYEYNGNAGQEVYYTPTASNNPNAGITIWSLPVTWLSFNAVIVGHDGLLSWKVANEINASEFKVQHSRDGIQWSNIGQVNCRNDNTVVSEYDFIHQLIPAGMNYYRLLQRDLDGRSSFSKIITLHTAAATVHILGNPVTDDKLRLQLSKSAVISLYTVEGRMLKQVTLGEGLREIQVGHFARGVYLLKTGTETMRFAVQ